MSTEPTIDALRAAYDKRRRADWPAFEQALEHPLYARLLRLEALHHTTTSPSKRRVSFRATKREKYWWQDGND